jgi:hypothetical protein
VGLFIVGVWFFGAAAAAALNALASAERPVLVAVARLAYALGLVASLLVTAVIFSAQDADPQSQIGSRTGWTAYAIGAALPVAVLCALAVRRAFRGVAHRISMMLGLSAAIGLYVLLPRAYAPPGAPLDGLPAAVHHHHALVVCVLTIPGLLVLAGEFAAARGARAA